VAIGAHNDHVGVARSPVDHDSILVFNRLLRVQGADSPARAPDAAELAILRRSLDSLRALRPPRADSIRNGADDDASGSMGLLEIAEAFATAATKPARSILFIWHAGEEAGLWGSSHFTDHPTVSRDSIVAQLNVDMIGRGAPSDITGSTYDDRLLHGDTRYLQVVGSRRLSTELGDLIDAENGYRPLSFRLDYAMDANGHPQNIYCRSDHYMYARFGIPVAFFTTGGHADYHQVTDEPQYIRYDHTAEVVRFIAEVAERVANLDHRVVVDRPVPNPALGRRQ
jgi:Zn-dependent M28 family amino/carboxypeptidase